MTKERKHPAPNGAGGKPAEPAESAPLNETAERRRRQEMAELNRILAAKRCQHCATVGCWEIYDRQRPDGRTRYVRCKACGRADQAPVIVDLAGAG